MTEKLETYYDVLRIEKNATIAEIVAAYHSARSAFSKDSVATYSLFSQEDATQVLNKLEEAYLVLSNIEKKREYDRQLASLEEQPFADNQMLEPKESPMPSSFESNRGFSQPVVAPTEAVLEATDPNLQQPQLITGAFLKDIRTRRSLSVEDVSRITKIPPRYLQALEEEDEKKMPARVYVQGFIKNLATLYKLDPAETAKSFTQALDAKKSNH